MLNDKHSQSYKMNQLNHQTNILFRNRKLLSCQVGMSFKKYYKQCLCRVLRGKLWLNSIFM